SDNCAANIRGCNRGCAKLGSRSPREDQRFLGRCGCLVPWSWIIVRVFKAKSGGYSKGKCPTQFFSRGARPPPNTFRCPVRRPSKRHSPHSRDAGRGLSGRMSVLRSGICSSPRADNTHVSRALWRTALHPSAREREGSTKLLAETATPR